MSGKLVLGVVLCVLVAQVSEHFFSTHRKTSMKGNGVCIDVYDSTVFINNWFTPPPNLEPQEKKGGGGLTNILFIWLPSVN